MGLLNVLVGYNVMFDNDCLYRIPERTPDRHISQAHGGVRLRAFYLSGSQSTSTGADGGLLVGGHDLLDFVSTPIILIQLDLHSRLELQMDHYMMN